MTRGSFDLSSGSTLGTTKRAIEIRGAMTPELRKILTLPACQFIAKLHRHFESERKKRLDARQVIQNQINSGHLPDFLPETRSIREADWTIASIPDEIQDRRVEITGPVDRKMMINALNSGAQVYMADFEDSHSPTWVGTLEGQINLFDAVRRKIEFHSPDGKSYALNPKVAVLFVRPRGWHLPEKHFYVDGEPVSASLFDFGLFFFHNAKELIRRGTRPYFYLPKLENHNEARLWKQVFEFSERELGISLGSIRATVLIETLLAAFEMDEILYELREYSAGLNCGRWDYIFSFIKKLNQYSQYVLPDRSQVTMNVPFLKSYSQLLIQTCHRRGAHAMGGMAAQIPIKNDSEANQKAIQKVREDKQREVTLGHDGTWVAHPALVPIAAEIFTQSMKEPNQIFRKRQEWEIQSSELLHIVMGDMTEAGLRTNINITLLYLESWLRGVGCVPLSHLMEDAATAEISRAQLWQWVHHGRIHQKFFNKILTEEFNKIETQVGRERFYRGKYELARQILGEVVVDPVFVEFLTLPAYSYLD